MLTVTGCTLARLLSRADIDVTVFESDASPDYRSQGGTLDLHDATGLKALKEAGLFEEFEKFGRYDGQYMAIVDKNLHYHFVRGETLGDPVGKRPEIDRAQLRQILAESLPEGMIRWGHHLVGVDGSTLIFREGSETGFDLIVGADGAWSKVRAAIDNKIQPFYLGVAYYDLSIPNAEEATPGLYKLVNRGSLFACNDGQRLSLQQMGDGSIYVHACFVRKSPKWMNQEKCGYDSTDTEAVKRALQKEFSDWCPELRDAILHAEGPPSGRSLHILPIGAKWQHKPGMTLIGDAAHLMTPFAGEGVNQALEDALTLAHAIIEATKDGKDLNEAVKAFEDGMFVRVRKIQQLSYDLCQDWMFTPGVPKSVVARAITRHVQQETPAILHPLVAAGMHSYFFFRSLVS